MVAFPTTPALRHHSLILKSFIMTILDQIFSDVPEVYRELMKEEIKLIKPHYFNICSEELLTSKKEEFFLILFQWSASNMKQDFWVGIYEELKYLEETK